MKRYLCLVVSSVVFLSRVYGFDMPTAYRPACVQLQPRAVPERVTTDVSVRWSHGLAHSSFGGSDKRTALFNAHGAFNLLALGNNLNQIDPIKQPVTHNLWGAAPAGTLRPAVLPVLQPNDGQFVVAGRYRTTGGDVLLKQTLLHGLYAHAYVPFKSYTIDNVAFKNLGASVVRGVNMDTFVTDRLPAVLNEQGLAGIDGSKRQGFGDPVISLGWEGFSAEMSDILSNVAGYAQIGVSLPAAKKRNPDQIFELPLGYNGHIGAVGRVALEACFFKAITVGVQAGSTTFLRENMDVRLHTDITTDHAQNGWIVLQKAHVKEDLGSLWDLGIYLKADKLVKGVAATVGYAYSKQEQTSYKVNDTAYLKAYVAAQVAANSFISQNYYANSDSRLKGWNMQTLFGALSVNTREAFGTSVGLLCSLEYNYPIAGKYTWVTGVAAGTAGFSVMYNF